MAKYRYSSDIPVLLYDIINPIILKLTKEEDSIGMAELGPFYSPPHDQALNRDSLTSYLVFNKPQFMLCPLE